MDFFRMKFGKLFEKKHGKDIFDNIVKRITQEKAGKCDSDYMEKVFKIAFLEHIGLKNTETKNLMEDILKDEVNIEEIKNIHKNSIDEIKEYLNEAMEETIKRLYE